MFDFPNRYKPFIRQSRQSDNYHGFDLRGLVFIEPVLKFLYENWWRVKTSGFENVPEDGPAVMVGNTSGMIPWPALMLIYALMSSSKPRRLNVVIDMDWIEDERLYYALVEIGFVPWSNDNLKRLFEKGELVAIFPEGAKAAIKTFAMKNRVCEFDWTRLLPVVDSGVKIFPLATLGCDESVPALLNLSGLSSFLKVKAFPVSPFFPWLPFPFNLASLPVKWQMSLRRELEYEQPTSREEAQKIAKHQSFIAEGEIQAELNRALRARNHIF
jgi:1-acyl-sn-glycerol-3-phosphate acyltransferase